MKKVFQLIFAIVCMFIICVGITYAEMVFLPAINVDTSVNGKIIVTVSGDSDNDIIFESEKPELSIPCDFDKAYVEYDGKIISSTLEEGQITFEVERSGKYLIINNKKTTSGSSSKRTSKKEEVILPEDMVVTEKEENALAATGKVVDFTDVIEGTWYEKSVEFVTERGIMNGTGDSSFEPNSNTTRAMLVQILYNLEGTPNVENNSKFTDVKTGAWYEQAVIWAADNKIVNGIGNNEFLPNAEMTREQMVTILHNYAVSKGIDVSGGEDTNILSYEDAFEISEWAIPAFQWAVGSNIVSGRTESTLVPKGTATRAEIATVMMNLLK